MIKELIYSFLQLSHLKIFLGIAKESLKCSVSPEKKTKTKTRAMKHLENDRTLLILLTFIAEYKSVFYCTIMYKESTLVVIVTVLKCCGNSKEVDSKWK